MKKEINATIKSSQGFYIGDICYALPDKAYDGVWAQNGYKDGEYEYNGFRFAVGGTAYGDGFYIDQHGTGYAVDAGNIGIIPLEIATKRLPVDLNKLGTVTKGQNATFQAEGGRFEIIIDGKINLTIDTRGEEDDEQNDELGIYDDDEDSYDFTGEDWE